MDRLWSWFLVLEGKYSISKHIPDCVKVLARPCGFRHDPCFKEYCLTVAHFTPIDEAHLKAMMLQSTPYALTDSGLLGFSPGSCYASYGYTWSEWLKAPERSLLVVMASILFCDVPAHPPGLHDKSNCKALKLRASWGMFAKNFLLSFPPPPTYMTQMHTLKIQKTRELPKSESNKWKYVSDSPNPRKIPRRDFLLLLL